MPIVRGKSKSAPPPPPVPTFEWEWIRSPQYRSLYSNMFKYRIGPSEVVLNFCSTVEPSGLDGVTQLQEDIAIIMTWTQFKVFAEHMNILVQAIEQEAGKITLPEIPISKEQVLDAAVARVKVLNYKNT